jgi:probable HAF family extracellular repeat protein
VGLDREGEIIEHSRAFVWRRGRLTELGTLGGKSSTALALNAGGEVVGFADTRSGSRGFVWRRGRITGIGGTKSIALAINSHGQVVIAGRLHASLWRKGTIRDLGTFGGRYSGANAINDQGQVVGSATTKLKKSDGDDTTHAFLWQSGVMHDLGSIGRDMDSEALALNERGQVFGAIDWGYGGSFFWQGGKMTKLGLFEDEGYALNDKGQLVGNDDRGAVLLTAPPSSRSVRSTRLDPLPGAKWSKFYRRYEYCAVSINERDQIVGWSSTKNGANHAVLWTLKR